jgi:hypothetical protein
VTAPRIAVAAVAVLVLAWLAVMERDWRLQEDGAAALQPGSTPAQLARAEDDLKASRLLNPDPAPDMNLALLASARRQPERALAGIEDVVRREPDNLSAWAILAVLSRDDAAARARAFAARRRLDPLNAR